MEEIMLINTITEELVRIIKGVFNKLYILCVKRNNFQFLILIIFIIVLLPSSQCQCDDRILRSIIYFEQEGNPEGCFLADKPISYKMNIENKIGCQFYIVTTLIVGPNSSNKSINKLYIRERELLSNEGSTGILLANIIFEEIFKLNKSEMYDPWYKVEISSRNLNYLCTIDSEDGRSPPHPCFNSPPPQIPPIINYKNVSVYPPTGHLLNQYKYYIDFETTGDIDQIELRIKPPNRDWIPYRKSLVNKESPIYFDEITFEELGEYTYEIVPYYRNNPYESKKFSGTGPIIKQIDGSVYLIRADGKIDNNSILGALSDNYLYTATIVDDETLISTPIDISLEIGYPGSSDYYDWIPVRCQSWRGEKELSYNKVKLNEEIRDSEFLGLLKYRFKIRHSNVVLGEYRGPDIFISFRNGTRSRESIRCSYSTEVRSNNCTVPIDLIFFNNNGVFVGWANQTKVYTKCTNWDILKWPGHECNVYAGFGVRRDLNNE